MAASAKLLRAASQLILPLVDAASLSLLLLSRLSNICFSNAKLISIRIKRAKAGFTGAVSNHVAIMSQETKKHRDGVGPRFQKALQ
jgi:hypothetical protein